MVAPYDQIGEKLIPGICGQDAFDRLCGFYRNRALFDDDLMAVGNFSNESCCSFDVPKVGRTAGSDAIGLGGCAYRYEDQISRSDGVANIRREVKVPSTGGSDHLVKTGFVDRQHIGVPCGDPRFVEVRDGDLDVRALGGNHRHGGAADIAGAETTDRFDGHWN